MMKIKKMKNLLMMLALVMSIGIMSCDDKADTTPVEEPTTRVTNSRLRVLSSDSLNTSNMDDWTELTASDLPQAIADYLTANHEGVNIVEAWRTDGGQIVILLENDIVLLFDADSELIFSFDLADYTDDEWDDDDYEEIDVSTLPQSILDYVAANYPDANIDGAARDTETGEIIVFLDNDVCLLFDQDGNFLEVEEYDDDFEEVDISTLPQAILDYVAANYADASIDEAERDTETGEYLVFLDNDVDLLFDADGNFLEVLDDDDFGDGFDEINLDDLPQAIKDYIAQNHADANIEGAGSDPENGNIYVLLDTGLVVVFDANGNFIEDFNEWEEDATAVAVEDLSQAIKDYVAANYADQTITEAWFNDEDKEYYVALDNDLFLLFDEAGNFIEIIEC